MNMKKETKNTEPNEYLSFNPWFEIRFDDVFSKEEQTDDVIKEWNELHDDFMLYLDDNPILDELEKRVREMIFEGR